MLGTQFRTVPCPELSRPTWQIRQENFVYRPIFHLLHKFGLSKFKLNSGDAMGLPRPPAFLDPSLNEDVILENGLNYASGGGGILNETGSYFVS